jgi:hypothetical protein
MLHSLDTSGASGALQPRERAPAAAGSHQKFPRAVRNFGRSLVTHCVTKQQSCCPVPKASLVDLAPYPWPYFSPPDYILSFSMSQSAPSAMPVTLAPFEVISSNDKTGLLIVITASTLAFAVISCFIRLYVRFFVAPPWKRDDSILAAAMVHLRCSNANDQADS